MKQSIEPEMPATKRKLVEATMRLILRRGFSASGVEQICAEAGVTKGAFFHYFKTKEEIGLAAMQAWSEHGMSIYSTVQARKGEDALARFHRLLDLMTEMAVTAEDPLACVIGMTAQETASLYPALRESSQRHFADWVGYVAGLLDEAKAAHPPKLPFDSASLAWMLHSLWQGSMLIGKTQDERFLITANLRHARNYIDLLFFGLPAETKPKTARKTAPGKVASRTRKKK